MRRRAFIAGLGSAAAWPLATRAQQKAMPVVGYLSSLAQEVSVQFDAAFRRGLSEMGYVEGQSVSIEYRWITDRYEPLPTMAADLVQRQVAVICAFGPPAVLAAKAATASLPIVFVTGADPIKFGFVTSFNRPGGNITGIWIVSTVLAEKRLQLMHELVPKAELIGLLVNPTSPVAEPQTRDAQAASQALGLNLRVLNAVTENDLDQVFAGLVQQRADALFVSADPAAAARYFPDCVKFWAETLNNKKADWDQRHAAAHSLMNRAFGKPPQAIEAHYQERRHQILEVRWLPPDPNDHSRRIEPEPD